MSPSKITNPHIVAGIDMSDLYPAPFPDDVPIVELETISLAKLLAGDEDEAQTMFEILKGAGFFYLDLTDHPEGLKILEDAVACCRLSQTIFPVMSVEEKQKYKTRDRVGIFDKG
jgi:isopenicillin N synthase-like dioxygenase